MKLTPKQKLIKRVQKAIENDPYLDKSVLVKKNGYIMKFKVEKMREFDGRLMYDGPVILVEGTNCPYEVGETFSVSSFEIRYYIILSK